MATTVRAWTADELLARPDDGQRCELVAGELRMMRPTGGRHGEVGVWVAALLAQHVRRNGLGAVLGTEAGFVLARGPDTVRAPDVAFVRRERVLAGAITDRYVEGAPDLAVEVVSPGDTLVEVEDKVAEYLAAGAAQVWVVNPKRETITVHAAGAQPCVLRGDDVLAGGALLPGFACPVREVFASSV